MGAFPADDEAHPALATGQVHQPGDLGLRPRPRVRPLGVDRGGLRLLRQLRYGIVVDAVRSAMAIVLLPVQCSRTIRKKIPRSAEPHLLIPANQPPTGTHQVLPGGTAIQVTGEEKHMPAILPYLNSDSECWIHATHTVLPRRARLPPGATRLTSTLDVVERILLPCVRRT